MKDRIPWIDIARGLGILFVIYAHTLDRNSIRFIFYAFHMPLFFFLTGIVHHHKKSETILTFLKKNLKRIVIPYFSFALVTYLWWYITQHNGAFNLNEFFVHMSGILYGSGAKAGLFFNTILWFLPCLFAAKVLLELLTRLSDKTLSLLISLGIFAVVSYFFSILYPSVKLPFHIETALSAVVFMGGGYLFYRYRQKILAVYEAYPWKIFSLSLVILLLSAVLNFSLTGLQNDMRVNRLNNVFLFYVSSFSGISATIAVSMIIGKNNVLELLGKISLYLFVLHPLIFYHLKQLTNFFLEKPLQNPYNNIFLAPIYTTIAVLVITFSILFFDTYVKKFLPISLR